MTTPIRLFGVLLMMLPLLLSPSPLPPSRALGAAGTLPFECYTRPQDALAPTTIAHTSHRPSRCSELGQPAEPMSFVDVSSGFGSGFRPLTCVCVGEGIDEWERQCNTRHTHTSKSCIWQIASELPHARPHP
ncbi:hypothetical protein M440DRAFT_1400565 [Trichoderma longibrachiatum ATCC 18648]|uniref:Secreted protein n=1 Tax=Trichoderma longibrachiatum ATCC 18648 TaxID=983965 RepID=A0A2T4C7Y3_TRILO|nr:hypothetical protein M440DRAFT_1400565 [Trichoderma longibrachiatum ATCC 18648]